VKQTLQLKLSQHLTLTPQLQQSIRLLQLSTLELNAEVERMLQENPLLEKEEAEGEEDEPPQEFPLAVRERPAERETEARSDDEPEERPLDVTQAADPSDVADYTSPDTDWGGGAPPDDDEFYPQQAATSSLRDHLIEQLSLLNLDGRDREIVATLIDAVNEDGYLTSTLEEIAEMFPAEAELGEDELRHWDEISRKMRVVFHDDGVISQFEGFEKLKPFDADRYRAKYGDIHRLDRILEAEGDSVERYQAAKQADVLMLFYLFSAEELAELFARLGYPFEHDTIPRNIAYYSARTTHGSTLSRVVDSWVRARSDREGSWRLFRQALESDIADVQGGTTPEGIHLGAMAGTVDLLQRGYTGIVTHGDALTLNPCLPREVTSQRMTIRYRGHALDLSITQQELTVHSHKSNAAPIKLEVVDVAAEIAAGQTLRFPLTPVSQDEPNDGG